LQLEQHGCAKYFGAAGSMISADWSVHQVQQFLRQALPRVFEYLDTQAPNPAFALLGKSGRNLFIAADGHLAKGEDLLRFRAHDGSTSQSVVYIGMHPISDCVNLFITNYCGSNSPTRSSSPGDIPSLESWF
jgi:hypothetical protein